MQVTELKERLTPMRGFWVSLPQTICNDEKAAADLINEDRCWNGQTRGRWARAEQSGGGQSIVKLVNNRNKKGKKKKIKYFWTLTPLSAYF